jgi:hypothetical protein
MNKDIAFQAINIYPRKHDIMCIYIRNILCRRERIDRHAPSTKVGAIDEQEEEKERSIDRR